MCAKASVERRCNVSRETRCLILGLRQHLLPCFVNTSSEGRGVCVRICANMPKSSLRTDAILTVLLLCTCPIIFSPKVLVHLATNTALSSQYFKGNSISL